MKKQNTLLLIILSLMLLTHNSSFAQIIKLLNPSFEGSPQMSKCPRDWFDCGFPGESAPDTQPAGVWEVMQKAQDGQTYVGMVVRDNDTWESMGQMLEKPLKKGRCYRFSMQLCRSELYVSLSHLTGTKVNYATPVRLRIWGGSGKCSKLELLGETSSVTNKKWQKYGFELHPKKTHDFIVFEAYYQTPTTEPYNGNILIDNASDIVPFDCELLSPPDTSKKPND